MDCHKVVAGDGDSLAVRSEVVGRGFPPAGDAEGLPPAAGRWRRELIDQADRLCRHRLDLFDLEDHDLGSEIDWNYEYKARKKTPMRFAPAIDYRSYAETGDCKFVWELNRHQHWVVLARAYRLTGDHRYAAAVVRQLDSWIRQCPYGLGMNWRSPLELGIRLINWVWALELIRPCGLLTRDLRRRVLGVVYRHLWDVSRTYSRFSSANNHLIGEAAGVFIASSYFTALKDAPTWQKQSREILSTEIVAQTWPDGGNREQAMGYHLFGLEMFLLAGLAARNMGEDFPSGYWDFLERMFEFLAAFTEGGDALPMFGDCDDGYVLDLDGRANHVRGLLAVGAAVFGRGDFKALSGGCGERVFWLLGPAAFKEYEGMGADGAGEPLPSRAFADTGYYLLQSGHRNGRDRISVTFDCGELGFGAIAAHGHADALSFTLRAFGAEVIVDPGTYDYFTYGRWRDYFRSTRAHNTVVVDGRDQSEMLGPFLWGRRAGARCLRWESGEDGGTVVGEHDGYADLFEPVVHRRTIKLEGHRGTIVVRDELIGTGRHAAAFHLHLAAHCSVRETSRNRFVADCGRGAVSVEFDPRLCVSVLRGTEEPILGWVSPGYHRKEASPTLRGCCEWETNLTTVTKFTVR